MYPEAAWLYPSAVTEGLCVRPSFLNGLVEGLFLERRVECWWRRICFLFFFLFVLVLSREDRTDLKIFVSIQTYRSVERIWYFSWKFPTYFRSVFHSALIYTFKEFLYLHRCRWDESCMFLKAACIFWLSEHNFFPWSSELSQTAEMIWRWAT